MPTPSPPVAALATESAATASPTAPRLLNRLFRSFQCLVWLWIGALSILMSRAVDAAVPIAWTAIGFRMARGFAITAALHKLFQPPRLRRLGRPLRWALICLATLSLLIGSLLPFAAWGIPTNAAEATAFEHEVHRLQA